MKPRRLCSRGNRISTSVAGSKALVPPSERGTVPHSLLRASLAGARQRGVPLRSVLAAGGLTEAELARDGRLPAARFARVLSQLGHVMRDEAVGFLEPPVRPGAFSLMCHATISAPNLRRTLLRGARYWRVLREDLSIQLAERGEEGLLFLDFPGEPAAPFFVESFFIVLLRWASWMIDVNILPHRISLTFDPPPYADEYEGMFPGQHFFGQRRNHLAFSARYLSMRVVQDPQTLSAFLAQAPAGLLRQHRNDISAIGQVRRMLARAEPPVLSLEQAASELALSAQTLRRRLRAEGSSFQELKDHVRRDQAVYLLLHAEASVNEVAERLGFSEPSTFHRAFKKWTGMAPGEYRDSQRSRGG